VCGGCHLIFCDVRAYKVLVLFCLFFGNKCFFLVNLYKRPNFFSVMKRKLTFCLVIFLLLVSLGFVVVSKKNNVEFVYSVINSSEEISISLLHPQYYAIEMTSSGFRPNILKIEQGDIVVWVNSDSKKHWPISSNPNKYPDYPDLNPEKPIGSDEEWIFNFERVGGWEYHDLLNSDFTGKIFVR